MGYGASFGDSTGRAGAASAEGPTQSAYGGSEKTSLEQFVDREPGPAGAQGPQGDKGDRGRDAVASPATKKK